MLHGFIILFVLFVLSYVFRYSIYALMKRIELFENKVRDFTDKVRKGLGDLFKRKK